MNDCQPGTAVALAALLGLAVLVGGLLAYGAIVRLRSRRLNYLLPSRPINIPRRLK